MADPFSPARVRAAYDAVADEYQAAFGADLDRLPLDRGMLDQARGRTMGGLMLDLGCGTGSAGSYLTNAGVNVVGLDLSLGMLRHCPFPACTGDMRRLPFGEQAFAAVVALYSIQHVARSELPGVLGEVSRVLAGAGSLLLSAHLGEGEKYSDEFLGRRIASTGGTLYSEDELTSRISSAGFLIEAYGTREPLPHEHQGLRAYVLALNCA